MSEAILGLISLGLWGPLAAWSSCWVWNSRALGASWCSDMLGLLFAGSSSEYAGSMNGYPASVGGVWRACGFGAGHADGLVDDGVEELVVVEFGLCLDVGSGAASCD